MRTYISLALLTAGILVTTSAPAMEVTSWVIENDGRHNAFTDLVRWKDDYYLCFRKGDGHLSMDGVIHIKRSKDLKTWTDCATLDTFGDDRDPHFTATDDKLYVYFGTWDLKHGTGEGTPERGIIRSYVSSSEDGLKWSAIQGTYQPMWWLWRVRYHDGKFWCPAYTFGKPSALRLLRSDDGVQWEDHATVSLERIPDEADILWRNDGSVWIVARNEDEKHDAMWFRSDSAMKQWEARSTDTLIHSPVLLEWNNRVFVAGRGRTDGVYNNGLWELKENVPTLLWASPGSPDCAYPGLIIEGEGDKTRVLMSWYGQHESVTKSESAAIVYVTEITGLP